MNEKKHKTILADTPGFGRVYDCGECGLIHCQIGAVSITFPPDAYMKLVAMIHTSATALDTWIQMDHGGTA